MVKADQKKILVLGGAKHMINVVKMSKRLGLSPIVVDNVAGSPAKYYADKSFDVSTADMDGLEKIIRQESVEFVYTAFEDITSWNAVALCKKMNLTFYLMLEQLSVSAKQEKFMEICSRFNVPVIEEVAVAAWKFPIVVAPVESYAGNNA